MLLLLLSLLLLQLVMVVPTKQLLDAVLLLQLLMVVVVVLLLVLVLVVELLPLVLSLLRLFLLPDVVALLLLEFVEVRRTDARPESCSWSRSPCEECPLLSRFSAAMARSSGGVTRSGTTSSSWDRPNKEPRRPIGINTSARRC